jgi:flavin-dependent dehydrogenase
VLDKVLVDAARQTGVEFRFGTRVTEVLRNRDRRVVGVRAAVGAQTLDVRADLVIGADGMWSTIAKLLDAPIEHHGRNAGGVVYTYFSGLDRFSGLDNSGYEWFYGDHAAAGVIPTNDGEALVFAATGAERFRELVGNGVEPAFDRIIERAAPDLTSRLAGARHTGRWRSARGVTGYLRRSHGPGWALVGDAGSFKDPIAAHGITDALRDAEALAEAVTGGADRADETALAEALAAYQRRRDDLTRPMLDIADEIASYRWTTDEIQDTLLRLNRAMNAQLEATTRASVAAAR